MILLKFITIFAVLNLSSEFRIIEKGELIGCYRDSILAPDLRKTILLSRNSNPNFCFIECTDLGYTYAATQYKQEKKLVY